MSTVLNHLIKINLLSFEDLWSINRDHPGPKLPRQDFLIESGRLKDEDLFTEAQKVFPRPTVDLEQITVDPVLLKVVPYETAVAHSVFPVRVNKDILEMAMSDPSDVMARDELHAATGLTIKPLLCRRSQIVKFTRKHYPEHDSVYTLLKNTLEENKLSLPQENHSIREEILNLAEHATDDPSLIQFVNRIIADAFRNRASDVHIEPQETQVDVRYRIDGHLKHVLKIPRPLYPRFASRIKIMAGLDIAERRKIQEGRIKIRLGNDKIDLRLSLIPLIFGEKIVLRVLGGQQNHLDFNKLGFEADHLELFQSALQKPQGVILLTGPTGSGKTTTLYAALQHLKSETKNIMTIEDPIEYLIEGVNQMSLSRFKDVTFASALRSILRQDPDIILVGEIRDRETADIAFRASLTGHLVFSTLHTNNAVATISRLRDLGLESYLTSSISLIVAQRLVRVICPHCCEAYKPTKDLLTRFESFLQTTPIKKFYHGRGCEHCQMTGFHGRTSIVEILELSPKIRDLIFRNASENEIFQEAVRGGMRTLTESGILKVSSGLTTLGEVAQASDVPLTKVFLPPQPQNVPFDPFATIAFGSLQKIYS